MLASCPLGRRNGGTGGRALRSWRLAVIGFTSATCRRFARCQDCRAMLFAILGIGVDVLQHLLHPAIRLISLRLTSAPLAGRLRFLATIPRARSLSPFLLYDSPPRLFKVCLLPAFSSGPERFDKPLAVAWNPPCLPLAGVPKVTRGRRERKDGHSCPRLPVTPGRTGGRPNTGCTSRQRSPTPRCVYVAAEARARARTRTNCRGGLEQARECEEFPEPKRGNESHHVPCCGASRIC